MNGKKTVLIADDNEQIRYIVETLLKSGGFDVLPAGTGDEALRLAQSHEVHLALIDFDMPGMHGQELARRMASVAPQARLGSCSSRGTLNAMKDWFCRSRSARIGC